MSNDSNIVNILKAVRSGKSVPVIDLVRSSPEIPALISKLVSAPDRANTFDKRGNKEIATTNPADFVGISNDIAQKTTDAESMMELFPEFELSAQILISSIISPKDMSSTEINFIVPPGLKSSDISASLLIEIKDYLNRDYKIEALLPIILRKVLFEAGSYPVAVIPESSIDKIINGSVSTEAINELTGLDKNTFKTLGILGRKDSATSTTLGSKIEIKTALESIASRGLSDIDKYDHTIDGTNNSILVTDNYELLKLPKLFDSNRQKSVLSRIHKNTTGFAAESFAKLNDRTLSGLIYKAPSRDSVNVLKIQTADESSRKTIGEPLVLTLPPESVIPVSAPGSEETHVGYFILIDMEGNPVNKSSTQSGYSDLQSRLNSTSNNNMSSVLLNKAKGVYGSDCKAISAQQATQLYGDIVEADLLSRLRNGVYGKTFSIGKNEEVYRLMLARTLRSQFTQLLFIPSELMTYFAYKFDNRGVGKSLLDDLRILNSLRAMVLFSKVMAELKNSIGRTNVNVELDEDDPNPQKTMETLIHEVAKTRKTSFPIGLNSPGDLADWIQTSGYSFAFSNHPELPNVKMDFTESNSNYATPSSDLDEDLRKRSIMGLGLSPETVDNGFAGEFATSVVAGNLLLTKRVMQIQEKIIPLLTDHVRKLLINNGNIINALTDIVKTNIDKVKTQFNGVTLTDDNIDYAINLVVQEFISNVEVSLPQPSNVTLDNQITSFEAYVEALDKTLPYFISQQSLPASLTGENLAEKVEEIKEVVKAYYCRRWLSENNIMGELSEFTTTDDKGETILKFQEIQKNYTNLLSKSLVGLLEFAKPTTIATDRDLDKIGTSDIPSTDTGGLEEPSTSEEQASDDETGETTDTPGESSDADFNMDNLGLPKLD